LHLLLQGLQGLVDVVVADENLNDDSALLSRPCGFSTLGDKLTAANVWMRLKADAFVRGRG
jgi:hypothetical protein